MNKAIRGKRYNTDTAESVGEIGISTIRWEELYRKRTGEFFLAHWTQSETEESSIEPIDTEEAKEWVETHCTGDEYENLFGTVGEGRADLHLTLPVAEVEKLRTYALERKISVSEAVSNLIRKL